MHHVMIGLTGMGGVKLGFHANINSAQGACNKLDLNKNDLENSRVRRVRRVRNDMSKNQKRDSDYRTCNKEVQAI